ncbi:MAG: tetratricopeptide repeat protein [Bacteroidales bacterium]|nr:tetratricopeptide repeat protein [Bacteroidales bacterium]
MTGNSDSAKINETPSKKVIDGTAEELLKKAAYFYTQSRFNEAAAIYEQILASNGASYKLYYNLGNSYYKSKELAPAILNYERALRLNPGDPDARFNLEMCQAKIVDKIDPIGMFFIGRWYQSLGNSFDSNTWAGVAIFFFLVFMVCLFAYFFTRVSWLKKCGFFVGIVSVFLSLLSLAYSGEQYHRFVDPDTAILFAPTITVKSSPDQSGTDLFIIHEGCKVTVLSVLGSWSEIELEDGNVGWLESKDLKMI